MYKNINGVNYEVINANTAKGKKLLQSALSYDGDCLHKCYNTPSFKKIELFNYWQRVCNEMENSRGFSICSHNTFMFTVSWATYEAIFYITPSHNYMIDYMIVC